MAISLKYVTITGLTVTRHRDFRVTEDNVFMAASDATANNVYEIK